METPAGVETRHLSIMFTDIKGFTSRTSLQSREELNKLLYVHDDLIRPIFKHHGGRVVKTIGDAFMVVFDTPTDAVLCGIKVQETLRVYNKELPKKDRLEVRVAINSGEANVKDGDVFGESVNIAARIESLAKPGTVYFTEAVYLSMNKTEVPSTEIGKAHLKGIPERIKIYKVLEHPKEQYRYHDKRAKGASALPGPRKKAPRKGRKRYLALSVLVIIAVGLLAGLGLFGLFSVIGDITLSLLGGNFSRAADVSGNFTGSILSGMSRAVFGV